MKRAMIFLLLLFAPSVWAQDAKQRLNDKALLAAATAAISGMPRDYLTALREIIAACPKQHLVKELVQDCTLAQERYRLEFRGAQPIDDLLWAIDVSYTTLLSISTEFEKARDAQERDALRKLHQELSVDVLPAVEALSNAVLARYRSLREEERRSQKP